MDDWVQETLFRVWSFKDEKISRIGEYPARDDALEVAVLRELVMSEENVEAMRRGVDAFNRGDRATWLAVFDPDAVMMPAREWPENAPIRGAEAIWDFYMEVIGAWDEGSFEFGEVIKSGADKIVANNRRDTRGRASGAGVQFSYWSVSTYRDGRTVLVEWFANRADALEAAGLRE